jgi:predicted TIM-barrel fold metal-dependent hydrolase
MALGCAIIESMIFDADNHYYEAIDAFTRHVPKDMRARCVDLAEIGGRQRHVVAGRVDYSVANPLFDPIAKPGVLYDYYRGNPTGRPATELMAGDLEPIPDHYRNPDARLAVMDEQGLDAIWLFPTVGVLFEELLGEDTDAVCTTFHAFNRWLLEDWGFAHADRIFAAPYISLADPARACDELDWALSNGARVVVMRPAAVCTGDGQRSPADPMFDRFWAAANEAGVTIAVHTGNAGYSTNGYSREGFGRASIGMSHRPSVKGLSIERAAHDFFLTLVFEKLFERFDRLRLASIENGSGFLPDLFRYIESAKTRNPWHFDEDPAELFKEHVWVNPFWEDDVSVVIDQMGANRVIFGSDWPHMEGLPHPRDIFSEIESLDDPTKKRFLHDNAAGLNTRVVDA